MLYHSNNPGSIDGTGLQVTLDVTDQNAFHSIAFQERDLKLYGQLNQDSSNG